MNRKPGGNAMKSRSLSFFLFVSMLPTNFVSADTFQEIPFRLEQNKIVLRGSIGDRDKLFVVIDTGATKTVIHQKLAEKLGLKKGEKKTAVVYGQWVTVQEAFLRELSLGPVTFREIPVLVADLKVDLRFRVDALIGMELLKRKPLTIDYSCRKIRFGPVVHSDFFQRVNPRVPFILFYLSVQGGRPLRLMLDTGAEDLILYRHKVEGEVPVSPSTVTKAIWGGMGRPFKMRQVILSDARLKETVWEHLPAFLLDTPENAEGFLDGIVGPSALELKTLSFDFQQGVVSWTL
jgi:predicted aspartyl protease